MSFKFHLMSNLASWAALVAAGTLFVAGWPEHHAETERATAATGVPPTDPFPSDPVLRARLEEPDLRKAAANGDEVAIARLAILDSTLTALRAQASAGDAEAALQLSGILSWGDRSGSLDVLRLPAVRDDERVQQQLKNGLAIEIAAGIRVCKPVDQALLRELLSLLQSLAAKGDQHAERVAMSINNVADPISPIAVMKALGLDRSGLLDGCR
ncbi:MAG: hypothetical protein KBA31_03115 [Alphaproteobacteria bacterium]|nr:hypothetical protein [Alphaproteobacteria bacterium]